MSPTTRLQQDGYKLVMTVNASDELGPTAALVPYVVKGQSLVIGTKGDKAEMILPLNDAGAALVRDQLGTVGEEFPGATAHMDGNDVTVVGPLGSFGETGQPGMGDQPVTPEPVPPVETAPAPETPTEPAAPTEQSGPVGTTFTVTSDVTGMYGTNTVSVDKVTYGLAPIDEMSAPESGNQLVGVTVSAKSVKLGDPTMSGVNPVSFTALGSDGVGYEAEDSPGGTASMLVTTFNGDFKFTGQHETGVIGFEMPKGVTITQVKYDGGDTPVTWSVGK